MVSARPPSPTPALNEGRSLNSGDTRCYARPGPCHAIVTSLNEGRSLNSGDTSERFAVTLGAVRSTKAGAGDTCSRHRTAQRRPEPELRRHDLPVHIIGKRSRLPDALNEGRSLNSGDTVLRLPGLSGDYPGVARSTKAGA